MRLHAPANSVDGWLTALRASGYRLTGPRRAVLKIVALSRRALNPAQIFAQARRRYPALGLVTVYRTLERLEALGLVQRVHQPHGCHAFLPAAAGHQHLLLCEECGEAAYFSGDDLDGLMHGLARASGYEIREHWLQLFGRCANCRAG